MLWRPAPVQPWRRRCRFRLTCDEHDARDSQEREPLGPRSAARGLERGGAGGPQREGRGGAIAGERCGGCDASRDDHPRPEPRPHRSLPRSSVRPTEGYRNRRVDCVVASNRMYSMKNGAVHRLVPAPAGGYIRHDVRYIRRITEVCDASNDPRRGRHHRLHAARPARPARRRAAGPRLRQARVPQPRRLGQGPHRPRHDRRRRGPRPHRARPVGDRRADEREHRRRAGAGRRRPRLPGPADDARVVLRSSAASCSRRTAPSSC